MDEKRIGTDLRAVARMTQRGPNCLDEYELAAVAYGTVAIERRGKLDEHLSECSYCLERVADLVALESGKENTGVPDHTLRQARELVQTKQGAGYVARWAAAAVIVLALGLVFLNQSPFLGEEEIPATSPDSTRQLRSIGQHDVRPRILAPTEDSHLSVNGGSIDWTEVAGSLYYDVRVVSLDGELVSEERVSQPHWKVPAGLLRAGAEYYVRVDAYLAEARRLSSKHVLFSVEQP